MYLVFWPTITENQLPEKLSECEKNNCLNNLWATDKILNIFSFTQHVT